MSDAPKAADAAKVTQEAIDAWSAKMAEALKTPGEDGQLYLAVPLLQTHLDVQLLQLKFEALFEELGAEQLVEPDRVMQRFLRKLERERKAAEASIAGRPRVQPIGGAVAAAINGKGRG